MCKIKFQTHLATEGKIIDEKYEQEKKSNPLLRLDDVADDQEKGKQEVPRILKLMESKERMKDDYKMNAMLRKGFRKEKKEVEAQGIQFADSDSKIKLVGLSEDDKVSRAHS